MSLSAQDIITLWQESTSSDEPSWIREKDFTFVDTLKGNRVYKRKKMTGNGNNTHVFHYSALSKNKVEADKIASDIGARKIPESNGCTGCYGMTVYNLKDLANNFIVNSVEESEMIEEDVDDVEDFVYVNGVAVYKTTNDKSGNARFVVSAVDLNAPNAMKLEIPDIVKWFKQAVAKSKSTKKPYDIRQYNKANKGNKFGGGIIFTSSVYDKPGIISMMKEYVRTY